LIRQPAFGRFPQVEFHEFTCTKEDVMSAYVYGSSITYRDYLQAKRFIDDLATASRAVSMAVSRQTRELIASKEALARENIRMMEASTDRVIGALDPGFEQLSYGLEDISGGISELNATFHWGFPEIICRLGHMNDPLEELVKIAKTPVQTWAFNHFEIARDAFRQGLFKECLEELEIAIKGDQTSSGYKIEWRFHQMKGLLHLGFADGDLSLIDLAMAEESFLLAGRYGKMDYPADAAHAFLSAGWAAYCQGKMKEALAHTEQSMALHPRLGEAFFQAAKVLMAMNETAKALPALNKAIDVDRFYALKAAGDGDFQKFEDALRGFLDAIRKEKYRESQPRAKAVLEKINFWREHSTETKNHEMVNRMEAFVATGGDWPLMDILNVARNLEKTVAEIEQCARNAIIVVSAQIPVGAREFEETYPEVETYEKKVVLKPAGLFRKAVTEKQIKTRKVIKTRTVSQDMDGLRTDFYDGFGQRIVSVEFCFIPQGSFIMGSPIDEKDRSENESQHKVMLAKAFYLGKYPVTQAQWEGVMGSNPSHFKGPDLPVEKVSWEDCQQFIGKLNQSGGAVQFCLPTEAEWEYACRAGGTGRFCFGDRDDQLGEYAWFGGNSNNQTHSVGQKKPNAWGLYDMHGNVWEWCKDWYGEYPMGSVADPVGPSSSTCRVLRGGSWCYEDWICRAASRSGDGPGFRSYSLGFRLAAFLFR
jgi:formylglycine-generating enzyme required for sulfatase activity/tetratricopeptide (TPR) repeat protein